MFHVIGRMVARLLRAQPFAAELVSNPLYQQELRSVRWLGMVDTAQFYFVTGRRFVLTALIVFILWLGMAVVFDQNAFSFGANALLILAGISLLATIIVDIMTVLSANDAIHIDMQSGRFDLLRLTMLDNRAILDAKYAVRRLRAWRTMVALMSWRFTVMILSLVIALIASRGITIPTSLQDVMNTLLIVLLLAFFVFESAVRSPAITIIGIAVSAGVRSSFSAILYSLFAVAAVWIMQFTLLYLFIVGASSVLNWFYRVYISDFSDWERNQTMLSIVNLLVMVLFWCIFLAFCELLRRYNQRRALARLHALD
jgi:hypothetical protein